MYTIIILIPIILSGDHSKQNLWLSSAGNGRSHSRQMRPNIGLGDEILPQRSPREWNWATQSQTRIPHVFCIFAIDLRDNYIFKTDQRTWGNNIVFLPKEAAIILTGSLRFSATCWLILFSKKKHFREPNLLYRRVAECTEMKRNEMKWVALSTLQLKIVGTQIDRSIILSSDWVIEWVSERMGGCGWVSEWVDVIDWSNELVDECLRVSRCGLVREWVDVIDWLTEWMGGCGWVS